MFLDLFLVWLGLFILWLASNLQQKFILELGLLYFGNQSVIRKHTRQIINQSSEQFVWTKTQINLEYFARIRAAFFLQPWLDRRKLRITEDDTLRVIRDLFYFSLECIGVFLSFLMFTVVVEGWIGNWFVEKFIEVELIIGQKV